jgi:hypothetical protein
MKFGKTDGMPLNLNHPKCREFQLKEFMMRSRQKEEKLANVIAILKIEGTAERGDNQQPWAGIEFRENHTEFP